MIYNGKEENRKTEIFTNFTMTITKEYKIDNKLCYSGYLVILNMTTSNETDSNIEAGFDLFNSSSTKKNLRNLKSDDITIDLSNKDFNDIDISQYFDTSKMNESEVNDLINQFRSVPIIKFDFFKNGEIREILYPKNLKLSILYNMNDLIDKIIPKVNKKLYQDDYDTVFGNQTNVYDDSDEDEVEEESEEEEENGSSSHERRRVRRLSNEIRTYRGIDNSSDNNSTNLIEINQAPVESDKIKLEGSTANSNIERKYNCNSNKIENINYSGEASLVNKLPNEEEQYNELLQEKTQSNILDVDLKQIDIKTNNSIEFIKNITDLKVISMLDEVFNKMEIVKYNQSEYTNTTLRILNSIPLKDVKVIKRNQNKIWKHVKLYKTKKIAKKHIEKLRNLSPDILKQKLEYAYNIFKTNIFGLKLQFQIIESFDMTNGKIDVQFILTIGCLDFVFPFKSFDSQINKIVNDSQLMTKKFMDILKESGKGITKLNKEYSPDLINYEKDLKDLIQNPYDFSNLYRKPYNDLYNSIKNFTTETFKELINTIIECHDKYSILLSKVKKGEEISINEIRDIIQNEYFSFIDEMVNNLDLFYNQSIQYLIDIENLVNENFQIDILYDINDNIIKAKKIFSKFVNLLFKAIEKGMSYFKFNLKQYIENLIGDLLQNSQFIAESLKENEILRNAISDKDRNSIINKLKDFKNIVNGITEYLYNKIDNDYDLNFKNDNPNNIKIQVTKKVNQINEKFEKDSSDLLSKIKKLIKHMELYELYAFNLDNIDAINNNLQNKMYNDTFDNLFILMNKKIDIYFNKSALNKKTQEIVDCLDEEILEINGNVSQYIKEYEKENKFMMLSNMTKIRKYFLSDEMKKLINEYYNLIIRSIEEKIKETIYDNYDKGIAYVKKVYEWLWEKRYKDAKGVSGRFLYIIPKFISNNAQLLTELLTEFPQLAKKNFIKIKEDILNYFENKLSKIKKYYLGNEIYKNFIDLYTKEINSVKDNIKFYFNEDVFLQELSVNISNYTNERVIKMDDEKSKEYQEIYDKIMRIQDYPTGYFYDWYWRWVVPLGFTTIRRTFKRDVEKEFKQLLNLTSNLTDINKYLDNQRIKFVKKFTSKFEDNINNYVEFGKKPYIVLNEYIQDKLDNNSLLLSLLEDYNTIINNDKKNNFLIFSNNMNQISEKLKKYFENIESNINKINDDYMCNNYYKDYESFLNYPHEINLRISYIANEFSDFSEKIKNQINQNYNNKISNHINLINNYSIIYTKNNFDFIQSEIYPNKIFSEYFDRKLGIIQSSFEDIYIDNKLNNEINTINPIEYEEENNLIIEKITRSVEDIDLIIKNNFTNYTFKIIDYSKYNFDIVKLRTSIYYIKNILDSFENLNTNYKLEAEYLINKLNTTTNFHDSNMVNKSLDKLQLMNKNSYNELNDYFHYYKDRLDPFIIYNKDYDNNIIQLNQILNNTITITSKYEANYQKDMQKILNDINKTLIKESVRILDEGKYNYNFKNYYNFFNTFINNVNKYFSDLLIISYKYGYNYVFTNSFLDHVDKLHSNKNLYYKNLIKSFASSYNIHFFNFTFDLSDYTENYMKENHINYFNFSYDYVNTIEKFIDNKSQKEIINKIKDLNETTIKKLNLIFDDFIYRLNKNKSDYIQKEYITELYSNRSKCSNYTLDHLEDEEQIIYLDDTNCTLINETQNNTDEICPFFNKTSFILFCNSSNYFNQKEFYYENINNKEELAELMENLNKSLQFYFNPIILSELLFNDTKDSYEKELSLKDYSTNITKDYFEYEISDFEAAGEILTYKDQEEYKIFLNQTILNSFNDSINEFIDSFIRKEAEYNTNIDILQKYNIRMDLFEIKLENELNYYLYLLDNSDEIGITTKNAFLKLYNDINKELEIIISQFIEEYNFEFDDFYMKNKRIFIEEYYLYLKNIKSNKIFKLNEYIDKIFSNLQFNRSLENIIKNNFYNNFIEIIKNNTNNNIMNKRESLFRKLILLNNTLEEKLSKVNISDIIPEMIPIMNKNSEYNNLIDKQSNSFSFNIDNQPYELFFTFMKENLEPPLLAIKTIYDKIQDELLLQIFKKIDEMPNYYLFIEEKYPTDNYTDIILNITNQSEELFNKYSNNLTDESKSYINQFNDLRRLYTIKKLLYLKQKYKQKNTSIRRLNINNTLQDETKIKEDIENDNDVVSGEKKRKLTTVYNDYLCFNDIDKILISNGYLIGNFSRLYLDKDFRYLNSTLKTYSNKIFNYLKKLENPLSIITLRMSTFLTEEKLGEFKSKLYREMNLIEEYSINHLDEVSSKINDFMNLLANDSISILNDTILSIRSNVEKLYDNLLVYIMNKFQTKKFKFTQEDIIDNMQEEFISDLAQAFVEEYSSYFEPISQIAEKSDLKINFDAEEYLDAIGLDKFLDSLEEYINNDEAPIEIAIPFAIFFIPFMARFRLEYGFEIGIEIYTKNHYLCSHFYAEAHSCASASAGIFLGIVEFGGGLRGLLGYGRIGMKPKIDFKYFLNKIEYYVKLATLKFQVFAYLLLPFPKIIWISIKFLFFNIRIPFIIWEQKRFEIGSQWTKGLQKYLSSEKEF